MFSTSEEKTLMAIEMAMERAIARIQAQGDVEKQKLQTQAEIEAFEYQLDAAIEVLKHRTNLKARNSKIFSTLAADFDLDLKLQEFSESIEEMGLDIIDEVQHVQKAKRTARRERVKHRISKE